MYADVMYLYPTNDYRCYLMHHGIRGQKWGVRRYQNYDGSLTTAGKARIAGDGQGFKARMKIRGQNFVNTHKDIINSTKAAKGIVNKASELVGHGRGETVARNQMYTQERLKNASKTRLGKHLHDVSAYNQKSMAEYHSTKRGQSVKRRVGEMFVPVTLYKQPMKTLTGRKTTVGMETLTAAMVGPIGNVALAGAYHVAKPVKNAVDRHVDRRASESYSKAKASYDKGQKEIAERESRNAQSGFNGNSASLEQIGMPRERKKRRA